MSRLPIRESPSRSPCFPHVAVSRCCRSESRVPSPESRCRPSGSRVPDQFDKPVKKPRHIMRPRAGLGVPLEAERGGVAERSEEHTSELQSLMRISYAVFCLKTKKYNYKQQYTTRLFLRHCCTNEST